MRMTEAARWPRLRTGYHQHRTNTGRLSSGTDPTDEEKAAGRLGKVLQVQNWPKRLRVIVKPDPGWAMIGGDWAQIQFALILWAASKHPSSDGRHVRMLDEQQADRFDAHTFLAAAAFGKDHSLPVVKTGKVWKGPPERRHLAVTERERQQAKPYTFGRAFKGNDRTLAIEAGHPLEFGQRACAAHDAAFALVSWQNFLIEEAARRHYVETPAGFRRYFWDPVQRSKKTGEIEKPKPQETIATYIQGAEAEILKWVLLGIADELGPDLVDDWREVLTTTHDSLVVQVREDRLEEGQEWLLRAMQRPVPWLDNRGWRAVVKPGASWRDV